MSKREEREIERSCEFEPDTTSRKREEESKSAEQKMLAMMSRPQALVPPPPSRSRSRRSRHAEFVVAGIGCCWVSADTCRYRRELTEKVII